MRMKNKIKYYRFMQGLSQLELGAKVGRHQTAISEYELRKKVPPRKIKQKIAFALGKKKIETVFPAPKRRKKR